MTKQCPNDPMTKHTRSPSVLIRHSALVVHFINTVTFAARDFSARRGANDEHIPKWICKERATKSVELPPGGLRRIWPMAALLVGYRPTTGYAPSSRLATGQIGRNERGRIYENGPLRQGEEGYIALALLNNTNGPAEDWWVNW